MLRSIAKLLNEATGSQLPRAKLNELLKEKATVTQLDIDSQSGTVRATFQLKGQPAPWTLLIEGLKISEQGSDGLVTWSRIQLEPGTAQIPLDLKRKLDWVL